METTTIDKLFPDVLEEIFSHLSASDLKNCALVCKAWNEVIGSSTVTMEKFRIEFWLDRKETFFDKFREILQSSDESYRKYQNMKILLLCGSLTQWPSLDRFNISQVKALSLTFWPSRSIQLNKVMELLSRMSLLQVLTVVFGLDCAFDTAKALVAHFKNLKQLNVEAHHHHPINQIFEFIKAENITELTYSSFAEYSDAEIDEVAYFIKCQKRLAKLTVTSRVFTQLLRRHHFSGMNLESMNLGSYAIVDSDVVVENFRKSLMCNAHSLTSLSIPSQLISKKVLEVIFNRLRKLTSLDIGGCGYFAADAWMENLSPNDIFHNLPLRTLTVKPMESINGLKIILQRAPQLKNLTLGHVTGAMMKEVATSAPRLVKLRIDYSKAILKGDQRFNELKSLTIETMPYCIKFVASLLVRCPKIEVLEGDYHGSFHHNRFFDILLQQKTLKHLRFNSCEAAGRRITFNRLKANFGNLKSLKLSGEDGKIIYFDFPDNPEEWNIEEQEARFSGLQAAVANKYWP